MKDDDIEADIIPFTLPEKSQPLAIPSEIDGALIGSNLAKAANSWAGQLNRAKRSGTKDSNMEVELDCKIVSLIKQIMEVHVMAQEHAKPEEKSINRIV